MTFSSIQRLPPDPPPPDRTPFFPGLILIPLFAPLTRPNFHLAYTDALKLTKHEAQTGHFLFFRSKLGPYVPLVIPSKSLFVKHFSCTTPSQVPPSSACPSPLVAPSSPRTSSGSCPSFLAIVRLQVHPSCWCILACGLLAWEADFHFSQPSTYVSRHPGFRWSCEVVDELL